MITFWLTIDNSKHYILEKCPEALLSRCLVLCILCQHSLPCLATRKARETEREREREREREGEREKRGRGRKRIKERETE